MKTYQDLEKLIARVEKATFTFQSGDIQIHLSCIYVVLRV